MWRLLSFRDLERAVEELSELIEQPLDPEIISSLRQKVTDKTVSTSVSDTNEPCPLNITPGLRAEAQRDCPRRHR